ncbi:MAG: hypothetical protein IJ306_10605 [Oscillospiraceae bacterium]|nr:hypothetical protein [Oscillospiraceae bacterium]
MKEKKEIEQEDFLAELLGKTMSIPEEGELFGGEELEHDEEENEPALEIFEHEALNTEQETSEKEPGEEKEPEDSDSAIFEKLAEIRGISKAEMKEEILWAMERAGIEKLAEEIMEENPGMNRKTAEELAKFRLDVKKVKREEPKDEKWGEKLKELDGFLSKHSGEAIEKLASAVVEEWESGIPLETAFEKNRLFRENERLLAELEQMKEEKEREAHRAYAREHGPGSATSAAGLAVRDEFIEGLFKEY